MAVPALEMARRRRASLGQSIVDPRPRYGFEAHEDHMALPFAHYNIFFDSVHGQPSGRENMK